MVQVVTNPAGRRNLLVWRTESLFCTPERRRLAGEWTHLRFTGLPFAPEPHLALTDFRRRVPFADNTFDAIYSFHVMEHLTPEMGLHAVAELVRVLRPGGTFRISTPDLALHAADYLQEWKRQREAPSQKNRIRLDWATFNLIDQAVRTTPGGKMKDALDSGRIDPEQVKQINGDSLLGVTPGSEPMPATPRGAYVDGTPSRRPLFLVQRVTTSLARRTLARAAPQLFLRLSHERNRWLYDQPRLKDLMEESGLRQVVAHGFSTSGIAQWPRYDFDRSPRGDYALEPSLYLEGIK